MPRCRDLAIFMVTTIDIPIDYFTLAHVRGVMMKINATLVVMGQIYACTIGDGAISLHHEKMVM